MRQRDKQQAVPQVGQQCLARAARANARRPLTAHSMAGSSTNSTFCHRIVPITPASSPSAAHCQAVRPRAGGRPEPREDRDGGHRRRVRHRRLFHEIPEDERAQRHDRQGQCGPPTGRVDPRQAVAEEQADQPPDQPGDADGLPVRIRGAVDRHRVPARGQRVGDPVADGEKRRPGQRRPNRPGRLGVAGRCGREQVRLVAEPEQSIVVGEIVVAVEPQRSQVREVVEAVTLQARAETKLRDHPGRKRQQEHRRDRPICHSTLPVACRAQSAAAVATSATNSTLDGSRSDPERGQPRRPRHGPSRQVDATHGDHRKRASDRDAARDHRSACPRGLASGSRSSRTKNGPVRTRPKIHTSSVISAVTPLSA